MIVTSPGCAMVSDLSVKVICRLKKVSAESSTVKVAAVRLAMLATLTGAWIPPSEWALPTKTELFANPPTSSGP